MKNPTFFFAILSGGCVAVYSIFLKMGALDIHPSLGAMVITAIAFLVNLSVALVLKTAMALMRMKRMLERGGPSSDFQ